MGQATRIAVLRERATGEHRVSATPETVKKFIALAHIQKPYFEPGSWLRLEVTVDHHRQHAPAKVVALPFYEPEWKKR